MIMENHLLLMLIGMFIKMKNRKLMDILMVMLSMKIVNLVQVKLLMDMHQVIVTMMNMVGIGYSTDLPHLRCGSSS